MSAKITQGRCEQVSVDPDYLLQLSHRIWTLAALVLFPLASIAVYGRTLDYPFVFDDIEVIVNNRSIHSVTNVSFLSNPFRYFTLLTFSLNYVIDELNPRAYRLTNIAIHTIAGLSLFGIVRRTLETRRLRNRFLNASSCLAFLTALLWLVHPLQTQSVTYVVQRLESMMGMFSLICLYCFIRGHTDRRKRIWMAGTLITLLIALMSKEVAIVLPVILICYDRMFLGQSWRMLILANKSFYGILGFLAIFSTALIAARLITTDHQSNIGFSATDTSPFLYAVSQPAIILHYLRLVIWPSDQCFDYLWQPVFGLQEAALPVLLITLVLVKIIVGLLNQKPWAFAGVSFFLILSPTSSILPIQDLAVEHRMYLALAPISAVIVIGMFSLLQRSAVNAQAYNTFSRTFATGVFVIAVFLGAVATRRNQIYSSSLSLWQDTANKAPLNFRAYFNLGDIYLKSGEYAHAAASLERSLAVQNPNRLNRIFHTKARLATAYAHLQESDKALLLAREAVAARPKDVDIILDFASTLAMTGKLVLARDALNAAIEIQPQNSIAHLNLGLVLQAMGTIQPARNEMLTALKLNPRLAGGVAALKELSTAEKASSTLEMAAQFRVAGDIDNALRFYRLAVEESPDSTIALNGLGTLLSRSDPEQSLNVLKRAIEIDPDFAEAHSNLGNTYFRLGNAGEAVKCYRRALVCQPDLEVARRNLDILTRSISEN